VFARFRHLVNDLTGRADADLLAHLVGQLRATLDGVEIAQELAAGRRAPQTAADELQVVEERGDACRRELISALAVTLSAPVDREDLFRLSRSIDDVLDNLRDMGREFALYEITSEPLLAAPLDVVAEGLRGLEAAVAQLVDQPDAAGAGAADAKRADVRAAYQQAMAELLTVPRPVDQQLLARRELLRRVDVVGLRLAEAADALADGTIKRSL
jgi:uncharacterized protein